MYNGETILLEDNDSSEVVSEFKGKIVAKNISGINDITKITLSLNSVILSDNELLVFYGIDKTNNVINMTYASDPSDTSSSSSNEFIWIPLISFFFLFVLVLRDSSRR